MTFQDSHDRFSVSLISCQVRAVRHTFYLLKCVRLFWPSFWHIFWQSFWHIFWHSFWHSFWHIFWQSFWHFFWHSFCLTFLLTIFLTFLMTYLLTIFLTFLLTFFLSDISSNILSDISSGILSGISSDILSDISSDILSDILSDTSSSDFLSGISPGILPDISSDILSRGWGPAGNTVEVRQGTLAVDGRGRGPAGNTGRRLSRLTGNTGRRWSRLRSAGNADSRWSRLRSGKEHLAQMVAVEVRQGTRSADDRGGGPARNTDSRLSWEDEDDEDERRRTTRRRSRLTWNLTTLTWQVGKNNPVGVLSLLLFQVVSCLLQRLPLMLPVWIMNTQRLVVVVWVKFFWCSWKTRLLQLLGFRNPYLPTFWRNWLLLAPEGTLP